MCIIVSITCFSHLLLKYISKATRTGRTTRTLIRGSDPPPPLPLAPAPCVLPPAFAPAPAPDCLLRSMTTSSPISLPPAAVSFHPSKFSFNSVRDRARRGLDASAPAGFASPSFSSRAHTLLATSCFILVMARAEACQALTCRAVK